MRTRSLLAAMQRQLRLDERALQALAQLPARARRLVLWAPGTNEAVMPAGIRDAFAAAMPDARIVRVPYEQSWQMRTSVPDGVRVLSDVLRGLAWLRARGAALPDEILMAGHSQGSWVGTNVLARADVDSSMIRRALFFANPGVNPIHVPGRGPLTGGTVDRVLELSNPRDLLTHRPRNIAASLDVIGGPTIRRRVRGALASLASEPSFVARLAAMQLGLRLRGAGDTQDPNDPDPHLYAEQALAGVRWLSMGNQALGEVHRVTADWT